MVSQPGQRPIPPDWVKVKEFNKKNLIASWRAKTQRHSEDRELNHAKWKPDTVNLPVRTARTTGLHTITMDSSTQYRSTESSANIPVPRDSDVAKWR